MKTLNKQIVNIILILICSLNTPSLFAQDPIVLTPKNVGKIAAEVAMNHGNGKKSYELAVLDFLKDQLSNKALKEKRCEPIKPTVLGAEFGNYITFGWNSEIFASKENVSYIINALNLNNFNRLQKTTTTSKVTFKELAKSFYLFSFIKNCLDSGTQSLPVIIIADKDIFSLPSTFTNTAEGDWRNKDTENSSLTTIDHWQVSPNPFEEGININWQSNKEDRIQIFLYDLQGRLLHQSKINVTSGPQSFWWSLPELHSGYYILRILTADQSLEHKLVKH